MIIKITIHDNDYYNLLLGFASKIKLGLYPVAFDENEKGKFSEKEYSKYCLEYFKKDRKYVEILSKESHKLSSEDKEFIQDVIREGWNKYIDNEEYFVKNFEVHVVDSVSDKWENGEVLYIFPSSYGNGILNF